MLRKLKHVLILLLTLLIAAPAQLEASVKSSKTYAKKSSKKYSKKRYSKKKKRYSKKRRWSKRSKKKRVRRSRTSSLRSSVFHVPGGYAVYGMDVSKYQGIIDWTNLRAPENYRFTINFAFMKATEGTLKKDPRFEYNWVSAAQNGVKRGAYHFYRPNEDVYAQFRNFSSSVKLSSGDFAPVIDVESRGVVSEQKFQDDLRIFIALLEKEYGVKPIIYTGYRFYHKHLSHPFYQNYPFWVAHYGMKDMNFKDHWKFWQFTCKGRVKGIKGAVDLNVFKGGLAELNAMTVK